jgi:hypothetical protein
MRRRTALIAVAPLAAAGVLVVAGCGGIDKGKLESAIKSQTDDQIKSSGLTVKTVHCTKTTDDYHFNCLITASDKSTLSVTASCDHDGNCKWKRA